MKHPSFLMALLGAALFVTPVEAAGNIKEAAKACEKEIPAHCVAVSCPAFCKTQGKKAGKCKKKCTLTEYCKLRPLSGGTKPLEDPKKPHHPKTNPYVETKYLKDPKKPHHPETNPYIETQVKLDAQNNDQLMACVAQKRDPDGKQSGRRMEDWKTLGIYK